MFELSQNDWRYYLAHAESKSKYDWSTGKNPPDYNHDYWEKNKEKILAKRKETAGVRDFGGNGVGYKIKSDDGKSYEDTEDWSGELTDEEKKNLDAHNAQVEKNIADVTKTVEDYIKSHPDMSKEAIDKMRKDLQTQIEIAREQMISTKNSDDRNYMMDLRKKNSAAKKSSGGSSNRSSSKSSSGSSKKSSKSSSRSKADGIGRLETKASSGKQPVVKANKYSKDFINDFQKNHPKK